MHRHARIDEGWRLREVTWPTLSHTASKSWDWNPGLPPSWAPTLSSIHTAGTVHRQWLELPAAFQVMEHMMKQRFSHSFKPLQTEPVGGCFLFPRHTERLISWETELLFQIAMATSAERQANSDWGGCSGLLGKFMSPRRDGSTSQEKPSVVMETESMKSPLFSALFPFPVLGNRRPGCSFFSPTGRVLYSLP